MNTNRVVSFGRVTLLVLASSMGGLAAAPIHIIAYGDQSADSGVT